MTDDASQEPKIIVDSDWKSQVEAEKEKLRRQSEAKKSPEEPPSAATAEERKKPAAESESEKLPPASFPLLVTTLASQVMAALGYAPDPVAGKPVTRLPLAKHFIDTLAVLEEKTKGNLSGDESAMLDDVLHELRMLYVRATKKSTT